MFLAQSHFSLPAYCPNCRSTNITYSAMGTPASLQVSLFCGRCFFRQNQSYSRTVTA